MDYLLFVAPVAFAVLSMFVGDKSDKEESHYDQLIAFFKAVEEGKHVVEKTDRLHLEITQTRITVPKKKILIKYYPVDNGNCFLMYNDGNRLLDFVLTEDGMMRELTNDLGIITTENMDEFHTYFTRFNQLMKTKDTKDVDTVSSIEQRYASLQAGQTPLAPIDTEDLQDEDANELLDTIEAIHTRVEPNLSILSVERQHEVNVSMEKEVQELLHAYIVLDDGEKRKHKERLLSSLRTVEAILQKAEQEIKAVQAYAFEKSAEVILQRKEG